MSASRLSDLQSIFCEFLLRGLHEDQIAAQLRPPGNQQAVQRLDIYRNGYFTRLEKALAHDFPVSERTLGWKCFARLAGDYVLAHPSQYPSLRNIGHGFADWLRVHAGTAIADLAAIEWAIMSVFDGPDSTTVESERMDAFAPADWPNMYITLVPTLTLLSLTSNADDVWRERGAGRKLEESSTRCIAISRGEQFQPKLYGLDTTSFAVLETLWKEPRLATVSERLAQRQVSEKVPESVAKALHIAFANNWVAVVSTSNSETGL
ncbi:MAG: putative DNA-binding domain-containing protein [Woeseia sp.]